MQSEKYFLVLSGTLIDGHEREEVEAALQHLLRVTAEQSRSMLAGERSRIRKALSLEKATHLRDKLAACGAGSFIEPVDRKSRGVASPKTAADSGGPTAGSGRDTPSAPLTATGGEAPAAVKEDSTVAAPPGEALDLELDAWDEDELEIGDEDTRPMEAVNVEEQADRDTEIVLESELVSLDSPRARSEPSAPAGALPASAKPAVAGKRRMLLLGLLLALLAVAAGVYFFTGQEQSRDRGERQPQQKADSKRAVTDQRLVALGRSVRAWMKYYGSGDPAQVTLDRMRQDLGLQEAEMRDGWGTPIAYQPGRPSYVMLSAGPDRQFGTGDDIRRDMTVE